MVLRYYEFQKLSVSKRGYASIVVVLVLTIFYLV